MTQFQNEKIINFDVQINMINMWSDVNTKALLKIILFKY